MTISSVGSAVHQACLDVREKVLKLAVGDEHPGLEGIREVFWDSRGTSDVSAFPGECVEANRR